MEGSSSSTPTSTLATRKQQLTLDLLDAAALNEVVEFERSQHKSRGPACRTLMLPPVSPMPWQQRSATMAERKRSQSEPGSLRCSLPLYVPTAVCGVWKRNPELRWNIPLVNASSPAELAFNRACAAARREANQRASLWLDRQQPSVVTQQPTSPLQVDDMRQWFGDADKEAVMKRQRCDR